MRIVVAAGDAAAQLGLDEIEFVFAEGGLGEDVVEGAEHFVGAFFQSGERNRAVALADLAFDGGGDVFEFFVDLIAGFGGRAAAADERAGHSSKTDFVGGIEEVAGADQREAAHQREFVVFEKVDLHAVRAAWIPRLSESGFLSAAGI